MEVKFLGHGLNTSEDSVGKLLLESFADSEFNEFTCLVAFASFSGIEGLAEHIQASKTHIKTFRAFVGIDQKGTSKEALESLLKLDIGASVYYTRSPIIFHPKIYIFEGKNRCRIIVGSSNLTEPGLFKNVESSVAMDFVRPDKEGEAVLDKIHDYYKTFFNGECKNAHRLTAKLIEELFEVGIIPNEAERRELQSAVSSKKEPKNEEAVEKMKALFAPVRIQKTISGFRPKRITPIEREVEKPETLTMPPSEDDLWASRGRLVWSKTNLPGSDVQKPPQSGSAPTGGLRMTKSGWRIDWTKYFRETLFGGFTWKQATSKTEVTEVLFDIKILGRYVGQHRLEIRHKPSGEAEQGNYTTLLSWGSVGRIIRDSNLIGKELRLYAPQNGTQEPFFIEIV